jgi:hypothetical protein
MLESSKYKTAHLYTVANVIMFLNYNVVRPTHKKKVIYNSKLKLLYKAGFSRFLFLKFLCHESHDLITSEISFGIHYTLLYIWFIFYRLP